MIKALEVDNFKSLVNFLIDFHENNIIVGNNATGKSSVLQAIDFLCNSVREDFGIILERRGWKIDNIKSKLTSPQNSRIRFKMSLALEVEGQAKNFIWKMILNVNKGKNVILLHSESVIVEGETVLFYGYGKEGFLKYKDEHQVSTPLPKAMVLSSSVMKTVKESEEISEELKALIQFLEKSNSFELLSPDQMRLSSRGNTETIGMSGKDLPSFIKTMNDGQKTSFMKKIREILGDRIQEVNAETKGKPGWTQINIKEKFGNHCMTVTSKEMSDGMLRLLAFIAISEIQSSEAVMLLDEVENGINADYAESLIKIMLRMYSEKRHQLIMTTHSTVFLDYIDAKDIIFLYRDNEGRTKAVHLLEDDYFKEKLEYMWPGEIFLNMSQNELVEKALKIQGGI